MARLSAITPSGHAHVGNYLGAIRRWAREGDPADLYFVSDLHAMTTPYHPQKLRGRTRELLAILIASGIEPDTVFVQSDLMPQLGPLTWVLECACAFGEAARMTQFKEKSADRSHEGTPVRVGLFTYPVLWPRTSSFRARTRSPSATTRPSTSSWPGCWRAGSTARTARRSSSPAR